MNENLRALCKELRKEASAVSLRELSKLDRSDRLMMAEKLRQIINDLLYVQTVADAQCSVVVEMFEHFGGHVPESKS